MAPMARQRGVVVDARDIRSFFHGLRRIGRNVGPRSQPNRRTKEDKELFCFRRYAATLAAKGLWQFPCTVCMGESPDFIIMRGRHRRGLEVTEATTETFQSELTRSERAEFSVVDDNGGWVDEEPENSWCEAVINAAEAKVRLITSYRPADCHDILIYSNHPADLVRGPGSRRPEYDRLLALAEQRASIWNKKSNLGTISVIDGATLLYDLIGHRDRWPVCDLRVRRM